MSRTVREIADSYVDEFAKLDPIGADLAGVAGQRSVLTNYSPAAESQRNQLMRSTLAELATADVSSDRDRVAADLMRERLQVEVDKFSAGEYLRDINILFSPVQYIRASFDGAPKETEADWTRLVARAAQVPESLKSIRLTYSEGLARGIVASKRQALKVAEQIDELQDKQSGYFANLLKRYDSMGFTNGALRQQLVSDGKKAAEALLETGQFLRDRYAPKADAEDSVGRQRYEFAARYFCGTTLDIDETYEWGWQELYRIEEQLRKVAAKIDPQKSVLEVADMLETDPARCLHDPQEFVDWLQALENDAIKKLDGVHFDIPAPVKVIVVQLDPPGGAAAPHYTPPSEDFSKPGIYWVPLDGRTQFSTWKDVTIAYHEGFPGHHLQCAMVMFLGAELNRFQQTFGWVSGHGEGWALYAERLMAENGFFDKPENEMGWLADQALRAARVVVDIGMHLKKPILATEQFHPGEIWTPELALAFLIARALQPAKFLRSEVDRYLGMPGQAISYKVGERIWLAGRQAVKDRAGKDYNQKAFHAYALALGPLGLDQLSKELANMPLGSNGVQLA